MKNMGIISSLHKGLKIGERDGQVTNTIKATIFSQVWHPYMPIHTITNKVIYIKVVDISLTRSISCKMTTYMLI